MDEYRNPHKSLLKRLADNEKEYEREKQNEGKNHQFTYEYEKGRNS